MSVLDPRELQASPLADLHALAAELGLEGYRRLRKADLIDQIVAAQGGSPAPAAAERDAEEALYEDAAAEDVELDAADAPEPPEGADLVDAPEAVVVAAEALAEDEAADEPEAYGDGPEADVDEEEAEPEREEDVRSGVLDVLPNGSGFIRAEPYRQSREDIYVSPAQIRRCELRPGDEVAGPVRPPRRNERHPSLVRVATVNGEDADTPSERPRFDTLTAVWPTERLTGPGALSETPYGKGSRVAIGGPPGSGATFLLREAAKALRDRHSELDVVVVLAGARPEEAGDWSEAGFEVAGGSYDGSFDDQAQVAELAVQRAKRSVEAGLDVVVVVDSLDALPPSTARRVFGAGRKTAGAGSLTVLASTGTAAEPHRMATTHVTLEPREGDTPRVGPGSGTLRRDLLA
jgi:transcription termination factor Rho